MGDNAAIQFPGTNPRPLAFRGALVSITAVESIADATTVEIPWDQADYDTDGFWDSGNPTRLSVPVGSGITKIRLSGNVEWENTFASPLNWLLFMRKNGTTNAFPGSPLSNFPYNSWSSAAAATPISSAVIEVNEGDYFELQVFQDSAGAENLQNSVQRTWFFIEVVESQPSDGFGLPTGMITEFGGTTAPAGFLLCDGAEVSKTTFAALFAVIGTAFDNSPAGGNFNVPDMRGRYAVGLPASATLGAEVGTALTSAENRATGVHTHDVLSGAATARILTGNGTVEEVTGGASGTTNITQVQNSSGVAGTNAPYVQLQYIIKT